MSYYDITYKCGHEDRVQIYGTNSHGERERKAEWYSTIICPECKRKARDAENTDNAEWNSANGCAQLNGSAKQIAWAETIRAKAIKGLTKLIETKRESGAPEEAINGGLRILCEMKSQTEASWWIDNREHPLLVQVSNVA